MRRWRVAWAVLVAALVPLLVPSDLVRFGLVPDLAVLVTAYVALEAGPSPAAFVGVALGLAACPWTSEPLGQQAFVLGATGLATGIVRQAVFRDRASVQLALVAGAAFVARLAALAAAEGAHGLSAAVAPAAVSAGCTALAAPPAFALFRAARLLRPAWRRSARV